MLTSKQRSVLKGKASVLDAIGQVGKGGISPQMIYSFSQALDNRELIKITVLPNSEKSAKEIGAELAQTLQAEFVIAIGKKVVLYRRSEKEGVAHIEIDK